MCPVMMMRASIYVLLAQGCVAVTGDDVDESASVQSVGPACTHFVSPAGSDADSGSAGAPWRTVQHALDTVGPGATICLAAGTYNENLFATRSGAPGAPITLTRSPKAAEAVIDGTIEKAGWGTCPPALWIYGASHLTVSKLTFTSRGNAGYPGNPWDCTAGGVWVSPDYSQPPHAVTGIEITDDVIRGVTPPRPDELGIALGISSYVVGYSVDHVRVRDTLFYDNDSISTAGIMISAVNIAGDVHDFEVSGNTFDDRDTGGVELGGNQNGTNLAPRRGVIARNTFLDTGFDVGTYAVYLQTARDMLVERNYFDGVGHGVGVLTEPPCFIPNPVIAGNALIRNNLFVNTRYYDLTFGAYQGSNVCPPLEYGPVENVYFTNNTVHRSGASWAAIWAPANPQSAIQGNNAILDNLIVTDGPLFDIMPGSNRPAFDYNYLRSTHAAPFAWDLAPQTFAQWQAAGRDAHTTFAPSVSIAGLFGGTAFTAGGYRLVASSPIPPKNGGAPAGSTTPPWADFGAYTPTDELDFYGGARDHRRRDIGADEY
jgi:hypothetical protein